MNDFNFKVPQDIVFGSGYLPKLPELVMCLRSHHAMIISDHGLEELGIVDRIRSIIKAAGIETSTFLDVLPNPTVRIVEEATDAYRSSGSDSIVALGGGSPMDVAKAVGVVARYGGSITEYEGTAKVPGPIEPLIAIPTTAGTGSEVTPFSVITDEERNYKLSVISHEILPQVALLDPELIMTAPASVAAACGIDAMVHAWEAYTSLIANPFSDAMAEKALDLIGANIRRFVANRQDVEAAKAMMAGSAFAGIAFGWARLGNVHAMSHPVSANFGVPHGIANAILLPTIVEYNALADRDRYKRIYGFIREDKSQPILDFHTKDLIHETRKLLYDLGIPEGLAAVGVTEDKIETMAADAMASGNIAVNPRQTNLKDVIALYHKAM